MSNAAEQAITRRHRMMVAIVLAAGTTLALVAAEVAARMLDGYRIGTLRLEARLDRLRTADVDRGQGLHKWRAGADAWPYVEQLNVAPGVNRNWFLLSPPDRHLSPPDSDLLARARRYPSIGLEANYEWNWNSVVRAVCKGYDGYENTFNQLDDMFVFDPVDGSDFPTFRFLQRASYPSGLNTNAFGWRSSDLPLNKPLHTVRIAFVGASTTVSPHAELYSYPELVGLWLEGWAKMRHPGLSIEVINAGREAINSRSIQAIVRQELRPLEPDLVLYYEGANQFWPADFVRANPPIFSRLSGVSRSLVASHSAVGRRLENLLKPLAMPGSEPPKPTVTVDWPRDLDEQNPDLTDPRLPTQLPRILADLETIRQTLEADKGTFVMTSFDWLVYPGMMLDPRRDSGLFNYLNTKYGGFTYAHMRRYLDFQNRVFRIYATEHHLDFIDVAGQLPRDPRLFDDAIHVTRAGMYLQSWVVFNGLVPIIERRLASHEWPRPARNILARHPAFSGRRKVPRSELLAACGSQR